MAAHPMTHHEILGLVEPFTRCGRHLNLAACDRIGRRLVFKPVERSGELPSSPCLREDLQLENPSPDVYRLTRVLTFDCGLQAALEAAGPHPGDLLARIDTVAPQRQFRSGAGFAIAKSFQWEPAGTGAFEAAAPVRLNLTRAALLVDGLTLTLKVPPSGGRTADVELSAAPGDDIDLPEDLLAVLGWDWDRLRRLRDGWRGSVRLRGRRSAHSRDAEVKIDRAASHLVRTLAEPPGNFHERLRAARWVVTFRRAIPLLGCFALIAAAAAVPKLNLADDSPLRMLIFNAPPLLLMLFFFMGDLPRIEFPPLPRAATAAAWRESRAPDMRPT